MSFFDQEYTTIKTTIKERAAESPSRLIDFLYILMRDHLPVGTVESIMWDQVDTQPSEYCNPFLEGQARNLAVRLLYNSVPITNWNNMYKSADGSIKTFDTEGIERPHYPEYRDGKAG